MGEWARNNPRQSSQDILDQIRAKKGESGANAVASTRTQFGSTKLLKWRKECWTRRNARAHVKDPELEIVEVDSVGLDKQELQTKLGPKASPAFQVSLERRVGLKSPWAHEADGHNSVVTRGIEIEASPSSHVSIEVRAGLKSPWTREADNSIPGDHAVPKIGPNVVESENRNIEYRK